MTRVGSQRHSKKKKLSLQCFMFAVAPTAKHSCDFIITVILFYYEDQPLKQSVG